MKYWVTILISVLLWGICSARTLDIREPCEMNLREGGQYRARGQRQIRQLKDNVQQKPKNEIQQLTSPGNYSVQFDLPDLTDPVDVGSAVDHYSLMRVSYDDVKFKGLRSAHQAVLQVNMLSQVATLTLNLEKAEVHGRYEGSDLARTTSGKFNISMSGNITYTCTFHYRLPDGQNSQLLNSSGQLRYQNSVSQYDAIISYSPTIQTALQTVLLQTVDKKVHQVLLAKLNDTIRQNIQEMYSKHQTNSVEKILRDGLNVTIDGILQVLAKHGVLSINLTGDDKEMVYNKLHAKIASTRLNGIEKFYLASNQVSFENSSKIRAKVQLAINKTTATTTASIQEALDEDAPFQKINVDFDIEMLLAELSFDNSNRQSGLELRSVQTNIKRIRPLSTEKLESQISSLIKEKLTSHIKLRIEEGLKNFIQNQFVAVISQGVLPPTQVKRSAHNQM